MADEYQQGIWGPVLNTISRATRTPNIKVSTVESPKLLMRNILTSCSEAESFNYADKLNQLIGEDEGFALLEAEMKLNSGFNLKENEEVNNHVLL